MWRRIFYILAVVTTLATVVPLSFAEDRIVFGPTDFKISKWHLHLSRQTIDAKDSGDGVIVITKNTPDRLVRGGFLLVNRRLIPLRGFFRGKAVTVAKELKLKSRNFLTVFLRGAPGASVSIAVEQAGNQVSPPQVTFSANPAAIHAGESSMLTWAVADADSVSIDQSIGLVDSSGSISVSPSQTTMYTLVAGNSGTMTTADTKISVLNTAPEAIYDAFITDENTPITTTNLLANDTDIDGDNLTISAFTQPLNGTAISHGNGNFTYTPDDGFSGTDSFTYTANDGHGGSDAGTVSIQVIPGPLTLVITSPTQGQQCTTNLITVTGTVNRTGASVFVNGVTATVSGGKFTADGVTLMPGGNTISVLAEDRGDTAVASITTLLLATLDLEPLQLEIISVSEDDGALNVSGQAMVTVANNGSSTFTIPYSIVLFEDTNLSGGYEENEDKWLGEETVPTGPGPGESIDVSFDFAGQLLFRDNRMHVCVDSAGEVEESDEANNITATQAVGIDISASLLSVDDAACPDEIALTVRIGNAGDTSLSRGVPVAFYEGEPENGGIPIGTVMTTQALEPGQYEDLSFQWADLPVEMAFIYAQADDDGTGTGTLNETDKENNVVFSEMAIGTSPAPPVNGIAGQIVDALTGDFLSGVKVNLHEEQDGNPGMVIDQTTTDEYGGYVFSALDPGDFILLVASSGYITGERKVLLTAGGTLSHQDIVLSPVLGADEIRIVLTWGEHPADLEAHLTAPNPGGCRSHCFYWNNTISGVRLDVDDRESYGPETITISQRDPGTYRFYVHDFTNGSSRTSTALSSSGATVTVYYGSGDAPTVFNVPSGTGTVWHVFNIDGISGAVTPIEKITHQSHPGQIDFPRITSSPVIGATYGDAYIYQIEAEDPDLDTLTYSLTEGPAGMRLDPFTGLIQWTPTGEQGIRQNVEIRVSDGRCGEDTQTFQVSLTYRPVVKFEIEPCSGMNPGGNITLTWQTERADTVVIDQGIGAVAVNGSVSIPSPEQPIPFTLIATNGAGQVQRTVPKPPLIASSFASCVASPGETSTLTWASIGAASCQIDQGIGPVPTGGSMAVNPAQLPQNYMLICSNAGGGVFRKQSVTWCTAEAHLIASTGCDWLPGDPVNLEWSTSGVDDCSIVPEVGSVPLNGSLKVWPSALPAAYSLSCAGASDSIEIKNPQSVDLAAASYALLPGESTTLSWRTTCFDTCRFDQGIDDVATTGSLTVTPVHLPATYTLTAINAHNTLEKSVTLRLREPTITFSASPSLIKPGESVTLTWTTARATACTIEPDIGTVPLTGSMTVSPDQNTTYTLTAFGPGGKTARNATVTYVKPTATIHADPDHLDSVGQTATLTWVFSNADTCTIDQGIGEVQLGGSIVVQPEKTNSYTITATGPGGISKNSVTVAYPLPTVEFRVDSEFLDEGETATLTWVSNNADTCTIDQGIGEDSSAGSIIVDPKETTTYTIAAMGPGGMATAQITLTCLAPTASIQANPQAVIEGQAATLSWQTDHAATTIIDPHIGSVDSDGSVEVTPAKTTTYKITASGRGGTATAQTTVSVINPPSISVIEPDGIEDNAHTSFTIRWADKDYDSDATISLYYDINDYGSDGTLIVSGLDENPDGLDDSYVWDTTGIPSGSYYVYALIEDGVNAPFVAYSDGVTTIDHAVTDEIKLTASDGTDYDSFGSAVSISGEYATMGAPYHDDRGAVYIFKHEGSAWGEQAKLVPVGGMAGGKFGACVSISGSTVVVGAPNENENQGAVYVFTHDGSIWTQQERLIAGDGQAWDDFGASVSINGDTLVVGAPNHNSGSGAAYIFTREGSTWEYYAKLTASNGDMDGRFGTSVSINGDALVIGSPFVDNQTGAAFIFRRTGPDWIEEARLVPGDAAEWSKFGNTVSISKNHAIVGNIGMMEAMIDGAAYIFIHDGSTWIEEVKINGSNLGAGENFGCCVAISDDMAAVGETNSWSPGAVYLFKRTGNQWIENGISVSGEGDGGMSGEGNGGSEDSGEDLPGDSVALNAAHKLTPNDGEIEDYFGDSVAMDEEHIIVGASFDDDKGNSSGSAYIYPLFSVNIDADPVTVHLGGGEEVFSTLSWSSRGADSVNIDPGIGIVSETGSITVAPQQTTTYTITATKNSITVTDSVTIKVNDPSALPTVMIAAAPESIERGQSATLSWSATNVAAVILNNGIGEAPMTGSLVVFPIETTSYTVTAANAGGTAAVSVTITVTEPLPIVDQIVEPAEIDAGDSAMLTWTTTHADMVSIEPGIGSVGTDGMLTVAPMQTTTYTITVTGPGGTATRSATVTVSSPISMQITEPSSGIFISGTAVSVRGTIAHAKGLETGLMVNGILAIIDGDQFTANHVPLVQGENTITAIATDTSGITLSDFITINAGKQEDCIRLDASPTSGVPPFETTLFINGTFGIVSSQISYSGPDEVIFLDKSIDEYRAEIMTEGVYTFSVEVTDDLGNIYTDEMTVEVVDEAALDALLQDKWAGMKSTLMTGDVEGALEYHHENARVRYAAIYNALGDDLATLAGQMRDISWICYVNGVAKYRIRQSHENSGQVVTIAYYIYFSHGENGLWLIDRY